MYQLTRTRTLQRLGSVTEGSGRVMRSANAAMSSSTSFSLLESLSFGVRASYRLMMASKRESEGRFSLSTPRAGTSSRDSAEEPLPVGPSTSES